MSEILSSLGSLFSSGNIGKTLSAIPVIAGTTSNIINGVNSAEQTSALEKQQKAISSLSPAQLTQMVTSAEAPINQNLVQATNNQVQGDLASRGLSQAPGIFASAESQAIAPIEQQNYNTALQQVLQQLGLPLEYAAQIQKMLPGQTNVTPAMTLLLQQLAKNGGSTGATGPLASPLPTNTTPLPPNINTPAPGSGGDLTPDWNALLD
jgi:hypothetical protein